MKTAQLVAGSAVFVFARGAWHHGRIERVGRSKSPSGTERVAFVEYPGGRFQCPVSALIPDVGPLPDTGNTIEQAQAYARAFWGVD